MSGFGSQPCRRRRLTKPAQQADIGPPGIKNFVALARQLWISLRSTMD
jgi:hypothetical protein